ncbi:hypothetical protein ACFLTA_00045 [Bacteroidota bacterium]
MLRRNILLIIFVFSGISGNCQDITYYYGVNDKIVSSIEEARNYKEVKKQSDKRYRIKTYSLINDEWILNNVERARKNNMGIYQFRYRQNTFFPRFFKREVHAENSDIIQFAERNRKTPLREGSSLSEIPLQLDGKVTEYHKDGSLKSESIYNDNQLVSNKYWRKDGTLLIENLFFNVDKSPRYLLGDKYLKDYIIHKIAEEKLPVTEIQDELLIGWVVTEQGTVGSVVILMGRVESVNNFFLNTISSLPGEWEPAVLNGQKVNYFITMPVNFTNAVPIVQNISLTGGMLMWDY